jgi:hypothetical protein
MLLILLRRLSIFFLRSQTERNRTWAWGQVLPFACLMTAIQSGQSSLDEGEIRLSR